MHKNILYNHSSIIIESEIYPMRHNIKGSARSYTKQSDDRVVISFPINTCDSD